MNIMTRVVGSEKTKAAEYAFFFSWCNSSREGHKNTWIKMYMAWPIGVCIWSYSCLNSVELNFTATFICFSVIWKYAINLLKKYEFKEINYSSTLTLQDLMTYRISRDFELLFLWFPTSWVFFKLFFWRNWSLGIA